MKNTFLFSTLLVFALSSCSKSSFFKTGTYEVKNFSYDYNINFDNGGTITFNDNGSGELIIKQSDDLYERVAFNYSVKKDNITFEFGNDTIKNYRVKKDGMDAYMIREFGYTIKINDSTFAKPCDMKRISGTWNWNTPDYINFGSTKSEFSNSPNEIGAAMRLKMNWSVD